MDLYYKQRRETNPSFSSTLLDAIYRSIDENRDSEKPEKNRTIFYKGETMKKKNNKSSSNSSKQIARAEKEVEQEEDRLKNLRRECLVEKWIEYRKKSGEKEKAVPPRRNSSMADVSKLTNSSSSSSESSSIGSFSSSESSDSFYASKSVPNQRLKPIKTILVEEERKRSEIHETGDTKKKKKTEFEKTKSRASKIYGDLKKVKQPISPGGRISNFLNSLFTGGGGLKSPTTTKPVFSSSVHERGGYSSVATTPACSSTSSFTRSCLSKPSSSARAAKDTKRSVSFCPVNVIVDENKIMKNPSKIRNYAQNDDDDDDDHHHHKFITKRSYHEEEEEEDDDMGSCSSSDLFELESLSGIGIERYREELPVYETTRFKPLLMV